MTRPLPGKEVVLTRLPAGFLDDLPLEDQQAISAMVGKKVVLNEYDDAGRAECEFVDHAGTIHFIWVPSSCLEESE